jgi:hypothetical protein
MAIQYRVMAKYFGEKRFYGLGRAPDRAGAEKLMQSAQSLGLPYQYKIVRTKA